MSIQLAILEKKVKNLEDALSFLGESLNMAFPSVGVSFDSVSTSIEEVAKEIEIYKAQKVRAKRNDVFERNAMLSRDDLNFLLRNYVPALAELVSCDRVYSDPQRGGLRNRTYVVDMGNLPLESIENAINPHGLVSHNLKLFVTISHGLDVYVEEVVTMDMETITVTIPHDPDLIPLVKWRVVNWFYDQVSRNLPSNEWVLPHPSQKNDGSSFTLRERRIYPAHEIYTRLSVLGDVLIELAEGNDTVQYGVNVHQASRSNQDSLAMHVFVRKEESDEWSVVLREADVDRPFGLHRKDVTVTLPVAPNYDANGFDDFVQVVENLDLRRLSRVCLILDQLCHIKRSAENTTVRDADSNLYRVEWIAGPKS